MDYLLGAEFSWLSPASWWAIAQVIIGLGFVIFVHELGHFLVAKACGVKCEKFYVGFDFFDIRLGDRIIIPRSLVKWQWGETEYGVGIMPLGGYVKMFGQVDSPAEMEKEIQRSILDKNDTEAAAELPSGLIDRSKLDPRSFLAKSVPQRMAIMSAGVIFNLIFAVIFAAIAFRSGVFYAPPLIGSVIPGGPAWQADMTGGKPIQIGDRTIEGYFSYTDMAQEIALHGSSEPIEFSFIRINEQQASTVLLNPQPGIIRRAPDLALIGVGQGTTNVLGPDPLVKFNPAERAIPSLKGGDTIIEINGIPVSGGFSLRQALARSFDKRLRMVVERKDDPESNAKTLVTVAIDRNPMRELGLIMKWKPIVGIQDGSPAQADGFQNDDVIIAIDGKPRGSLTTLDQRLTKIARDNPRPVEFTIRRGGAEMKISVTPRLPRVIPAVSEQHPIAIDTLGIAIPMSSVVDSIVPDSSAEKAGIQAGDELLVFEYRLNEEQADYPLYKNFTSNSGTLFNRIRGAFGFELNDRAKINLESMPHISVSELIDSIQALPVGAKFGLTMRRDAEEETYVLKAEASEDFFLLTRGIMLVPEQEFYRSESVSDSLMLGFRQTVSDSSRIWKFLVKLLTGKISAKNLGGPGTIALVATNEASEGTSRLLLFLTLLSANLAIVNFLPIPVLDGGHMVFLMYEGLFRKPVTPRIQERLMIGGLLFLVVLMVSVLVLDMFRIASLF